MVNLNLKHKAFTLSQMIITMVIIAVIFAISTNVIKLINPIEEGFATMSKKTEIALDHASIAILLNNCGNDDYTSLYDSNGRFSITDNNIGKRVSDLYKKYLQKVDIRINLSNEYFFNNIENSKGLVSDVPLKDIYDNFFLIQDGVLVGFRFYNSCSATEKWASPYGFDEFYEINDICGSIFYDVNSFDKPNKLGLDQHIIAIYNRGIKYDN